MSNRIDTKIVLGSKRYKSAIDTDLLIEVPLNNTQKELDEFDRSNVVSLAQVFDDERQESGIFRITAKMDLIFFNAYSGFTSISGPNYTPFTNSLYYVDTEYSFNSNSWSGYPQYVEFDLIRNDNNVSGYTVNSGTTAPHIDFVNKSASTYNWTQYISYVYDNDYTKKMEWYRTASNNVNWLSGEGIPVYVTNPANINGQSLISFTSPVEHGLSNGEWVQLDLSGGGWPGYNGIKTFQVYSLGNSKFNSEKYVFNIYNNGFTGGTFPNSVEMVFKRIIDITNSAETMSKYYVRKHKILTNAGDAILTKAAFDQNGFGVKRQYEYSSLTPDKSARITQKEGNQSYLLTFSKDVDINLYRDNLKRPLSELYITVLNKGYFGWMNWPFGINNSTFGLREGFGYNLSTIPNNYWSLTNGGINLSSLTANSYNRTLGGTQYTFYYNEDLKSGDTINGDYCEFNEFEQRERVLSDLYHKLRFNPDLFKIVSQQPLNPDGYYYKPHSPITLRVYSDYIEEGLVEEIDGVPDYAYYSQYNQKLLWRDLYSYGFIDESGNGVDYPFINGAHYPSTNIIFRVIPEGNIAEDSNAISTPVIDECE